MLVVEDDDLLATLLKDVLQKSGFEVEIASNAADAIQLVENFDPDGALLDIHLGAGPSGLSLGNLIHLEHPDIGLIFLTKYPDPNSAGLDAWNVPEGSSFLSKSMITDVKFLETAIEDALLGRKTFQPSNNHDGPLSRLTRVQVEILRLAACGLTNSAIAKIRSTKERTVEQRLHAIYQTLDISESPEMNPRVEAVRIYIAQAGLPSLEN